MSMNLVSKTRGRFAIEKVLGHSGIKGMKWGIRRRRGPDGTVSSGLKTSSRLTDQELQAAVNRMRLEQEFVRLSSTPKPKSLSAKGRAFALDLLKDVATTEVRRVAKGKAAIAVEEALAKRGQEKLAERIAPGGKKKKK